MDRTEWFKGKMKQSGFLYNTAKHEPLNMDIWYARSLEVNNINNGPK